MLPLATTVNINYKITLSACLPACLSPLPASLPPTCFDSNHTWLRCRNCHYFALWITLQKPRWILWEHCLLFAPFALAFHWLNPSSFAPLFPLFPFPSVDCNFSLDKRLPRDGEADKNQPIRSTSELSFWGEQGRVQKGGRERGWEGNWKYLQKNLA